MITTLLSSLPRISGAFSYAVRVEARTMRHEARSKPGDFWPAAVIHAAAGGSFLLVLWISLHTLKGILGDGDPELSLALASAFLASYAFLWFCIAIGFGGEIVPISRLEKLAVLRWTPGQAYAAGQVMAAFQPLHLFFSLAFLTTGLTLFPPAGAASVLFTCLATGVAAFGMVAWIQGTRCAIELVSWKGALWTLARVLGGGAFLALTLLLAWSVVGGDWIERLRGLPGSWFEMAPTSQLARACQLAGEGGLADLPAPLALLGAFAAAGFLFGWRLTRRRVFLAGGSRLAPAGPCDRIPGLARWLGRVLPPPYPNLVAREVLSTLRWRQIWIQAGLAAVFACCTAILPALALFAGKGRGDFPYTWQNVIGIALLAFFQSGTAANLFSREGRGACEYLLLPLDERQILASKNIAFAVIQYGLTAFCAPALLFVFWFHDLLGAGFQVLGAVVLAPVASVIAGNYLSILNPARQPASKKDPRGHVPRNSGLLQALVTTLLIAAAALYFSIDSEYLRHAAAAFGIPSIDSGYLRYAAAAFGGLAAVALPAGYVVALRHQTRLLRQRRLAVAEVFS